MSNTEGVLTQAPYSSTAEMSLHLSPRATTPRQPIGDPDCRLGVKTSSNQERAAGTRKPTKEYVWGYGSGVVAATDPSHGDVVLAEYTQPFNAVDSADYHPLYGRTVATLGVRPTNVTADAAFDAWHIYETCAPDGLAAIPLNTRGQLAPQRQPVGTPLCPTGLAMRPSYRFAHTAGYRAQEFRCPLLHPHPTGQTCAHAQFAKGPERIRLATCIPIALAFMLPNIRQPGRRLSFFAHRRSYASKVTPSFTDELGSW